VYLEVQYHSLIAFVFLLVIYINNYPLQESCMNYIVVSAHSKFLLPFTLQYLNVTSPLKAVSNRLPLLFLILHTVIHFKQAADIFSFPLLAVRWHQHFYPLQFCPYFSSSHFSRVVFIFGSGGGAQIQVSSLEIRDFRF